MKNLTDLPEWQALAKHHAEITPLHLRDWFANDPLRFNKLHIATDGMLLDYSRNRITHATLPLLCELANALALPQKIQGLFTGQLVNATEERPALHTALRDPNHTPVWVNGKNIANDIVSTQEKMRAFTASIHQGTWQGATGKPIQHIVNIGIGGSYTGPMLCIHALKDFAVSKLQFHFISTIDATHVNDVLQQIDLETTLFIISSKSFTTLEPLTHAKNLLAWAEKKLGKAALAKHFIAITAAPEKALAVGIVAENIFPLWDWVGGRYSIWSAIGLPLMLMCGPAHFQDFLAGAYAMDQHFRTAPLTRNMPVILAMLGIWYSNFFAAPVQAIVPYSHRLRYLIPYLQQAEMESNGKNISAEGKSLAYATSPVIFGEEGCTGQHSYHQLLHQGHALVPVDFIMVANNHDKATGPHQHILLASALSQAQALMRGKTEAEAYAELLAEKHDPAYAARLAPHKIVPGNKPSNVLFLDRITPKNLGRLIALYEHKIFAQGVIWQINSFDQWGVELGKQLLPDILQSLQAGSCENLQIDCATAGLIQHWQAVGEEE